MGHIHTQYGAVDGEREGSAWSRSEMDSGEGGSSMGEDEGDH